MTNGMMITFEGGEGSGKSSVINRLLPELLSKGLPVVLTREPGGTKISEEIRSIILDKANTDMDPKTEALLYCAARRQHLIDKVFPALAKNQIVLSDRYLDSSLVYQGFARGIGMEEIRRINLFAIDNRIPDLTVYFDVRPEVGLARIGHNSAREINRLDLEQLSFHQLVHEGYRQLSAQEPERIRRIDAEQSFEDVYQQVLHLVLDEIAKRYR